MGFGRAFHAFLLEPETFSHNYVIAPPMDRRTKEGKAIWQDLLDSGKEIVSASDWEELNDLKRLVMEHPRASKVLKESENEGCYFAEIGGIKVRSKIDGINKGFIFDVKTCQSASKEEFIRSMVNYNYARQGAFYNEVARQNGLEPLGYLVIAVERKAKFGGVAVYEIGKQSLDLGLAEINILMEKYKFHIANPFVYSGYSVDIEPIELPQWKFTQALNKGIF